MHLKRKTRYPASLLLLASLATACAPRPAATPPSMLDGPPDDLKASAAALYEAYGSALTMPRREDIAYFYHHNGAIRVFNGVTRRLTRAELRSQYEGSWSPPAYFAWEGLSFDSIGPGEVLVTGGFRWQGAGQRDTTPYIYAALLVAVDSGMAIVFEHETLMPHR